MKVSRQTVPIAWVLKVKYTFWFRILGNLEAEVGLDSNVFNTSLDLVKVIHKMTAKDCVQTFL